MPDEVLSGFPTTRGQSEEQLVERVLAQQLNWEEAFWVLLRRSQGALRHLAASLGTDPGDLCLQLVAFLQREEWRPLRAYQQHPQCGFVRWITTVARRMEGVRDRPLGRTPEPLEVLAQRDGSLVLDALTTVPPATQSLYVRRSAAEAVQQALSRMKHPRNQEVLRRYYLSEENFTDIAESMRLTRLMVRQIHHQNRRMLGHLLLEYLAHSAGPDASEGPAGRAS
ncbi:MAG TPA: sigma factor-like helix-turn-helix DNA-binding protein [Armatimonadota bacterium]|jgi:DNA-directed RNA polymerase specialized sigma24 family protein